MAENYVLALADIDPAQTSLVGGKAANLAAVQQAGFPVPAGLCLTTAAFDLARELRRDEDAAGSDIESKLPFPKVVLAALRDMLPVIISPPDSPLAVRSSATLEDDQDRSYAGVFSTILGVRGEEALLEAILACWSSVLKFTNVSDRPESQSMAVLIQPLVEAECAGVCFSVDPVQGSREQLIVSASWGLGVGVVDGSVANDTYWISRDLLRPTGRQIAVKEKQISLDPQGGVQETPVAEERRRAACLPDAWLGRIAQYALAAEGLFGRAQDMEWAIAGDEFWLLQSRPITALSKQVSRTPPFPVTWERDRDGRRAWERYPLAGLTSALYLLTCDRPICASAARQWAICASDCGGKI